jgi:DNA-binding MarR family transcriptional regulator
VTETIAAAIKQSRPFDSREEEVVLAVQRTAARILEPWMKYLKSTAQLTVSQYNVLRILRGARPSRLPCTEISNRMVARDPDVTRLIDRLAARGLVDRTRDTRDRRVVEIGITNAGLALLKRLDPAVKRYPKDILAGLGPKRLEQLATLLQDVLASLKTFPADTGV